MFTPAKPDGSVETESRAVIIKQDSKSSFSTDFSSFPRTGTVGTTTASQEASATGGSIAMSNISPVSSSRSAAESSAMVTSSPSLLSIAWEELIPTVSSPTSSSYSLSVPIYEGGASGILPMMVMIFVPTLPFI